MCQMETPWGYGSSYPACLFTCSSLWVDAPRAPSLSRVQSTNVSQSGLLHFLLLEKLIVIQLVKKFFTFY
jgi:hypothetical protein